MIILRGKERESKKDIKHCIEQSVLGSSGHNVYASEYTHKDGFVWHRIYDVRIKGGRVEGKALNDQHWFVIYNWETR